MRSANNLSALDANQSWTWFDFLLAACRRPLLENRSSRLPMPPRFDYLESVKGKEEERKLRWLISPLCRQGRTRELRYYLLFLLLAHRQYAKALKECDVIPLAIAQDDPVASLWKESLQRKRAGYSSRSGFRCTHTEGHRGKTWN
jgi:hypothetical protein